MGDSKVKAKQRGRVSPDRSTQDLAASPPNVPKDVYVVPADDKRRARLNCMAHLLSQLPYVPKKLKASELPERRDDEGHVPPPREIYTYVPDHAASVIREASASRR